VDLCLLIPTGERKGEAGRWETVYSFRREAKPEISSLMFEYCVLDYWHRVSPDEKTLVLRSVASAPCSPGQVFKLTEEDVRSRLEDISKAGNRGFSYQPSAVQGLLTRQMARAKPTLAKIYEEDLLDA
jgi:hypothetical protein